MYLVARKITATKTRKKKVGNEIETYTEDGVQFPGNRIQTFQSLEDAVAEANRLVEANRFSQYLVYKPMALLKAKDSPVEIIDLDSREP